MKIPLYRTANSSHRISNAVRAITRDRIMRYGLVVSLLCIISGIIVFLFQSKQLPTEVPLYYSLARGPERLARHALLVIVPIGTLVVLIVNMILSALMVKTEEVLARILMIGAALVSFLGLYTLIRIIILITE